MFLFVSFLHISLYSFCTWTQKRTLKIYELSYNVVKKNEMKKNVEKNEQKSCEQFYQNLKYSNTKRHLESQRIFISLLSSSLFIHTAEHKYVVWKWLSALKWYIVRVQYNIFINLVRAQFRMFFYSGGKHKSRQKNLRLFFYKKIYK